jgi:hypothetical protein
LGETSSKPARTLYVSLRRLLEDASNDGRLRSTIADIRQVLKPPHRSGVDEVISMGDRRNFHRSTELPHLVRDDRAWFDFAITLRDGEVVAWSFEVRFPDQVPAFLRFDLNPPGHDNEGRDLRCHLHPGTDDDGLAVPLAADWTPERVLGLVVGGLRRTGRVRAQ